MVPGWDIDDDFRITPTEHHCPLWAAYKMRERMVTAGVPRYIADQPVGSLERDGNVLVELRNCYEHGLVMGAIGDSKRRERALLVMTSYLARQPRHRPFRVQVLDIAFRSAVSEYWSGRAANPMLDLLDYKGCLFLLCASGSYPQKITSDLQELVVTRGMQQRTTVVIDGTTCLIALVRESMSVRGCML